ncbi:MAG TPA: prepilin-type N-terminal cleavage/methylation domain-containing protein [Geobacteraceae bacterium]
MNDLHKEAAPLSTAPPRLLAASAHAGPNAVNGGFTLVELLIVVAIMGILVALSIPSYQNYVKGAKVARCRTELITIDKDINAFFIDKGVLPTSLNEIGRGILLDPWGNPYAYYKIGTPGTPYLDTATNPLNADYDLYSLGADGLTDKELLLSDIHSKDDVIRAYEGAVVQLGEAF